MIPLHTSHEITQHVVELQGRFEEEWALAAKGLGRTALDRLATFLTR